MKKPKLIPQKPSGDRMTEQEVKTLWIYEHAERLHVRLLPEERSKDDRQRTHEALLSDGS